MRTMAQAKNLLDDRIHDKKAVLCRRKQRWTAALFISSVFGIILGGFGLVISGLNAFGFLTRGEGIGRVGSLLIVVAFPLVMFSAHCLDKIDQADKAIRIERCKFDEKG